MLAFVSPAAVARAERKPCAQQEGYRVLKETAGAVAAWRPNSRDTEFRGLTYRACLKSVGRWRTLHHGVWDGHSGHNPERVALGGRYAAVSIVTDDGSGAYTSTIDVVNLRTGHHRGAFYAGRNDGP